jgi:hypothetical protein
MGERRVDVIGFCGLRMLFELGWMGFTARLYDFYLFENANSR